MRLAFTGFWHSHVDCWLIELNELRQLRAYWRATRPAFTQNLFALPRLTHRRHILETEGESYLLQDAKRR